MLGIIALLLVIWLAITVVGAVIKGLFWLAVIGVLLFVVTSALGWRRKGVGSGGRRSLR
ncbi:MAG: hypothetical protein ACXVX8_05835 [Blastococcus sp.]